MCQGIPGGRLGRAVENATVAACADINRVQAEVEYDFVFVDQESFEQYKPTSFRQLVEGFTEYREKI